MNKKCLLGLVYTAAILYNPNIIQYRTVDQYVCASDLDDARGRGVTTLQITTDF